MNFRHLFFSIMSAALIMACTNLKDQSEKNIRKSMFIEEGFTPKKFDLIMDRIFEEHADLISQTEKINLTNEIKDARLIISPHDDAAFVGYLYPALFKNLTAKTVFVIGVAHRARNFKLEDHLIFDSYNNWETAKGNVPVSEIRDELLSILPKDTYIVHDSMQLIEHSVESILPYMKYYNPNVEIVSILVPYMNFDRMKYLAGHLSDAILKIAHEKNMAWGKDYAIAISTDAVHYGDEGWGGTYYDRYGLDSTGYEKAVSHEWEIVNNCLKDEITEEKVQQFINYTVEEDDYKTYKWAWCGRYCVPLGLLTSEYLNQKLDSPNILQGIPLGYSTSISNSRINIDDIILYESAQADLHHWVGYPAVVYK